MKLTAVILTRTSNDNIFEMTSECVSSLLQHAHSQVFSISVLIIESERNSAYRYPETCRVICPGEQFNFHRFLNIGIRSEPASDWYLLCNNDLQFTPNWLKEIEIVLQQNPNIGSISPISPTCKDQKPFLTNAAVKQGYVLGYDRRKQLSGWCLMVSRNTLEKVGGLDERFDFYFADDDYALSLRRTNSYHALALRSHVFHLEDRKISKELANLPVNAGRADVPKLLREPKYRWILQSDGMLKGFIAYTNKWGDFRSIAVKKKLHNLIFLKLGIRMLSPLLFKPHQD